MQGIEPCPWRHQRLGDDLMSQLLCLRIRQQHRNICKRCQAAAMLFTYALSSSYVSRISNTSTSLPA